MYYLGTAFCILAALGVIVIAILHVDIVWLAVPLVLVFVGFVIQMIGAAKSKRNFDKKYPPFL